MDAHLTSPCVTRRCNGRQVTGERLGKKVMLQRSGMKRGTVGVLGKEPRRSQTEMERCSSAIFLTVIREK